MQRIPRDPDKFDAIDLFDALARKHDFKLGDEASQREFICRVSESFSRSKDNPIVIHGRRIEAMFGYVAASLGGCIAIKREDAGEIFA